MTVDDLCLRIYGRTVAEQAEAIRHWEEVERPARLRDINKALEKCHPTLAKLLTIS